MSRCSDLLNRIDKDTDDMPKTSIDEVDTSYNLTDIVPKFHKYKKKGNVFDDIYTMEDNIVRSAGVLITGEEKCKRKNKKNDLRMGDLTYFDNGICDETSEHSCRGKTRSIIVDNTPADRKGNKGLIPSLIGDLTDDINPGVLLMDIAGMGKNVNSKCKREDVTLTQFYPGAPPKTKKKSLCVADYFENFMNFNSQENEHDKRDTLLTTDSNLIYLLSLSLILMLLITKV